MFPRQAFLLCLVRILWPGLLGLFCRFCGLVGLGGVFEGVFFVCLFVWVLWFVLFVCSFFAMRTSRNDNGFGL